MTDDLQREKMTKY